MLQFPFLTALPGVGNWQTIDTRWWSPTVTMNFAGNPAVEREVTEDVASYGRQIGWLNDIVTALVATEGRDAIKRHPNAADSLHKLEEARHKIEAIKKRRADTALDSAKNALDTLAKTDRVGYQRLVRSLDRDGPKSSP
ncbi:MAG TPA: hypothetical protein VH249_23260 [Xanthobacteraceae bacterium]|jgi:hypothetical protein|nr:hypothetical protein [Xanthobacteraceae bacterium]